MKKRGCSTRTFSIFDIIASHDNFEKKTITKNNTTKIIVIGPQGLVTPISDKSANCCLEYMERPIHTKFDI